MPELDQDLVNLIMLGLLGLIVLELLGVWGSISRNRRAIDRLAKARERDNSWTSLPSSARSDDDYGGRPADVRPQPAQEPQQRPVQREPEPTYAGTAPPATQGGGGQPQAGAVSAGLAGRTAPSSADTGQSGSSQEPQEQPFERDGRWWFRRGSELLVYDEASGQWLPAPPSGPGGTSSATQPMPSTTISDVSGATAAAQPSGEQGFWKCPTCGAVNGSTATTCRMCFTARP